MVVDIGQLPRKEDRKVVNRERESCLMAEEMFRCFEKDNNDE